VSFSLTLYRRVRIVLLVWHSGSSTFFAVVFMPGPNFCIKSFGALMEFLNGPPNADRRVKAFSPELNFMSCACELLFDFGLICPGKYGNLCK